MYLQGALGHGAAAQQRSSGGGVLLEEEEFTKAITTQKEADVLMLSV
jgi:hypothetical protein